jgi:hypothetical protein
MDELTLTVLKAEVAEDCRVLAGSASVARERFGRGTAPELLSDLQDLRGFRHVVRHAYDLTLKKDKMSPLLDAAERTALRLPAACEAFFSLVSTNL